MAGACQRYDRRSSLVRDSLCFNTSTRLGLAQRAPLFKSEVLPVLEKNCVSCHGPARKMAGLDLSTFAGLMDGGSSGPAIAPGKPDRSLLYKLIETDKMPMGGKLSDAEKQLLRAYIEQGRFPSAEAADLEREAKKITPEARNWWSFRKPVKPAPRLKPPVDAHRRFVLAKLEEKGWAFQPKRTAARSSAGRPRSDRPSAHARPGERLPGGPIAERLRKVVDELLASPHYGEHWGRHWLDVAGYSDSVGDADDSEREVAWKYRDYVINAFNRNKPYDRFLLEQLAGDQLINYKPGSRPKPEELEPLTATGFLRMTADITDNQTIYQVDKYFDALREGDRNQPEGRDGPHCPVRALPRPQVRSHPAEGLLQADLSLSGGMGSGKLARCQSTIRRMAQPHGPRHGSGAREAWIKEVTSNDAKQYRRQQLLIAATYDRYRRR